MIRPSIDELLEKVDDRYSLVIATSKRARQIMESDEFDGEIMTDKPVTKAAKEILDGKVIMTSE
jgi:DNA-directed RNA polymerase subunit omega